jgi:ubiquinone/menaquinone biosynthesis C-methylase UbiE
VKQFRGSNEREADEVSLQRAYYRDTASRYDSLHVGDPDGQRLGEHDLAAAFMIGAIPRLGIRSVLDIGSGTGRALSHLKASLPDVRIVGIEPSAELRAEGHAKGLSERELIDGDAQALNYAARSFDLVCEFGSLHHMPRPTDAVAEMLRVARTAVFISDSNNFGQGGPFSRFVKQAANACGLWPLADLIKTRGKGYTVSEGDGLAYSYSVFNDYRQIREACAGVHIVNTAGAGINPYRSASHVALLGIKTRDR